MPKFSFVQIITLLVAFVAMGQAHMIMKTPKPFGSPNNSPLDPSGSDFPCKGGPYDRSGSTPMPVGSTQTLSFTGSAVHSGGSCQIALTTDLAPSASTKWMVIKSIEGGCPASVSGNLAEDPNGSGASTFPYTIPNIAPGEYVLAWTWINKSGNREFYMNCAPITVTAGQQKRYAPMGAILAPRADTYPGLAVFNIKSINSCVTKETFDYNYQNPGAQVQKSGTGPYMDLECDMDTSGGPAQTPGGGASPPNGGSTPPTSSGTPTTPPSSPGGQTPPGNQGPGGNGNPSGSPSGTPSGAPSGTPNQGPGGQTSPGNQGPGGNGNPNQGPGNNGPSPSGTLTGSPGAFASGSAPLPSGVGSVQSPPAAGSGSGSGSSPAPPSSTAPTAPVSPAPPASGGGSTSASGSNTPGTACSNEGEWSCNAAGNAFQRCASGQWSQPISVPGGMNCTPGNAATIAMSRVGGSK